MTPRARWVAGCAIACLWAGLALAQGEAHDPELRAALVAAMADDADGFHDRFDAQVWLMDMDNRAAKVAKRIPQAERLEILREVHREATRAGLRPELVLAVIQIESAFDRWAISHAGARGLMQVMPFWLKEIGHPDDDLFAVRTNLRMGCTILKHYLGKSKGDLRGALNRYNGTRKRHYADKVLRALNTRWYV
jgi:soluble lytic murein transglycosylase-like protein